MDSCAGFDWNIARYQCFIHTNQNMVAERQPPPPSVFVDQYVQVKCGKYTTGGTPVRQSEGSGFNSRSGHIAYFHSVKTRLSTLGTGDVPRGSDLMWGM